MNVGTPLYMSPESLKKSYYSSKTDIYSLGIILFEMMQGKTPFESSNEKELLEKMNNEVVIPETIKHNRIR
jgi:serine/threonine protein kinase